MSARAPIGETLRFAYRDVFADLPGFLAACWLPLAVVVAAFLAVEAATTDLGRGAIAVLGYAVWLLVGAAFIMRWHRRVLFGEPVVAADVLRFNRRDIRAALTTIAVALVMMLPAMAVGLVAGIALSISSSPFLYVVLPLAVMLLPLAVSGRLMLAFPLCAVDAPEAPLRTGWRMSQGETWPLLVILLGTCLPAVAVAFIAVAILAGAEGSTGGGIALQVAQTLVWFLQMAVGAAAASFLFRRLGGSSPASIRLQA
jgi:hypothetical protein